MLKKYCKAYLLKYLRQLNCWKEKSAADESELADKSVVYLWDDFTVMSSQVTAANSPFLMQ